MFYWEKLGKIFTPQLIKNRPWLKNFAQAPATLVFDNYVRVFFSCRPLPDKSGSYVSLYGLLASFISFNIGKYMKSLV